MGTILVVHDELNSLELPVFKKDDGSKPELRYFPNGVSDSDFTVLDLTRFTQLISLEIGDHCLSYVTKVNLTGLYSLESVEIGVNSFTQHKNYYGQDPNRHFYLKNCPKLKSLKVGRYSFSDYSVFEIENVDALEVIKMGFFNEWSDNFYYASLQLTSILIHRE